MEDFYDTLGVPKDADSGEIHQAYRDAAKRFHPDRSSENAEGERFRAVQEAYETLGNSDRKREYDRRVNRDESGDADGERVEVHVRPGRPWREPGSGRRPPVWPTSDGTGESFSAPHRRPPEFEDEVEAFMALRLRLFEQMLRDSFGGWR